MLHRQTIDLDIWVRSYRLYLEVLSKLWTVSKAVHWEEDFAKLCDDTEAEHTALLYYCDTRWLYRDKELHRVFELKEEAVILSDANLCYDDDFT
jgi:hypothetical protein